MLRSEKIDDVINKKIDSNDEGGGHNERGTKIVGIFKVGFDWIYRIPDGQAEKNEVGHLDGEIRYHPAHRDVHPLAEKSKPSAQTSFSIDIGSLLFYVFVPLL